MKEKQIKHVLEAIVQRDVPEDVNLWPRIAGRVGRNPLMQAVRTRPALALAAVLLALALLSSVAYAIGRVTGYIPGIGIVSQPLRVPSELASVTREGITLTVEQLVLGTDKTVLLYRIEGIPEDAYPPMQESAGNSSSSVVVVEGTPGNDTSDAETRDCFEHPYLRLPDGSTLSLLNGQGNGWATGFEYRAIYGAIPADVRELTILMVCVNGTLLGKLPEDWEIPIQLVPAPPDMAVLPVVEVPSPSAASRSAMTLEKVIEMEDSYILIGTFRSRGLPLNARVQTIFPRLKITDQNGLPVETRPFYNLEPGNMPGEVAWGYEIKRKQYAWPLTLTIEAIHAAFDEPKTEFEFDTGPNPLVGQTWTLNQEEQLAGYTIRVVSIERTSNGYAFVFQADPDVIRISPEIKGFPYLGGYGEGDRNGNLSFHLEFGDQPPSGKLTVQLGDLEAVIHGPWSVQWSPAP